MTEFLDVVRSQASGIHRSKSWVDFAEMPCATAVPLQNLNLEPAQLSTRLATCVRLDWEDLRCFDVVDRQYESWGIRLANAIALRPSNPAYSPYSGDIVLLGAPKNGWLEITFLRPVNFVSGFITSSRRTVVTAFDANNRAIARTETAATDLASSHLNDRPQAQIHLHGTNIHRVTFRSFDGQLTLDDLCFSY